MPVRKVRNGPSGKIITRFHGFKAYSEIIAESQLEQRACFYLELNPQVIYFESQPLHLEYLYEGEVHRYTPDFLVAYDSGETALLEIKPFVIVNTLKFRVWKRAIAEAAGKLGYKLEILTDLDLSGPHMANAKLLFRYLSPKPDRRMTAEFEGCLADHMTLGDARLKCLQMSFPSELPFQLMATHQITFDWDVLISSRTLLSPRKNCGGES